MKYRIAAAAFAVTACAVSQPFTRDCTLILKPRLNSGGHSQALMDPYTVASIHHVKLDLSTLNGETITSLGIQRTLLQAQLSNPIVFSNLKPNTNYRILARAYADAEEAQIISTEDSRCYVNVTLTDNDRPTIETIPIQLIDRTFNGQATSSLAINSGGYSPIASETLQIPRVVTTLAGNGSHSPILDGLGTSATFYYPTGVVPDAYGNLYVVGYGDQHVRKITPGGYVTTFAGSDTSGYLDATGTAARFASPHGITIDSAGNLYVADEGNSRIRKITPERVVTTIAGSGLTTFTDGTGTAASFYSPRSIARDASGNLYVADRSHHRIRKIDSAGVVTTVAGNGTPAFADGTGTQAAFHTPSGIAVDSAGNLYIGGYGDMRVRKITPAGVVSTLAGNGATAFANGQGTAATFYYPAGMAVDGAGNVYVGDEGHQRIRKITPDGVVTTFAGSGAAGTNDGLAEQATFNCTRGIALDAWGTLYVADEGNHRIRVIR